VLGFWSGSLGVTPVWGFFALLFLGRLDSFG